MENTFVDNQEELVKNLEKLPEEQRNSALQFLMMMFMCEKNLIYANFKDDVSYSNRYLPTENMQQLLDELKKNKKDATKTIRKGSRFFRARIIDDAFRLTQINKMLNALTDLPDQDIIDFRTFKYADEDLFYLVLMMFLENISKNITSNITFNENDNFQGYDKQNSGVAPPEKVPAGRLNAEKISYLYTAKDKYTAICEVKPYIGQSVSVATLKTNKTLKLFDLTRSFTNETIPLNDGEMQRTHIMTIISKEFKKPNHNNEFDYLPTQYITEFVKEVLKFDGIYFGSSLDKKGVNAVFFDSSVCDILSSEIVHINNIKLSF